jgi:hypothetical protein
MNLSSFLIRIIFLSMPGIVTSLLYRHIKGKTQRRDWEDYLEIFLFSLLAYGLYDLYALIVNQFGYSLDSTTFREFMVEAEPVYGRRIIYATIAGIFVAFGAAYADEYKLIHKFARFIRATKRFGDEDVWDYVNRSPDIKWVYVRDHQHDLYYYGWIQAWSDPYKERELLLREVDVFKTSTAEHLYTTDVLYLSRGRDDLTIEANIASDIPAGDRQEPVKEIPAKTQDISEVEN